MAAPRSLTVASRDKALARARTCYDHLAGELGVRITEAMTERGLLNLDRPIADYWPEFAQAGKAGLPVRWALSHSLGMPAWAAPQPGMGYDWERATAALAAKPKA